MTVSDILKLAYTRLMHDRSGAQLEWTPDTWLLTTHASTGAGVPAGSRMNFYDNEAEAVEAFMKAIKRATE